MPRGITTDFQPQEDEPRPEDGGAVGIDRRGREYCFDGDAATAALKERRKTGEPPCRAEK